MKTIKHPKPEDTINAAAPDWALEHVWECGSCHWHGQPETKAEIREWWDQGMRASVQCPGCGRILTAKDGVEGTH